MIRTGRTHAPWKCAFVALFLIASQSMHALGVSLNASHQSPARLGTLVTFTASTLDAAGAQLWYRFRVRAQGTADFQMIRDFGPLDSLDWTPRLRDGAYEMEVAAQNRSTGEVATSSTLIQFQSAATADQAAVTPTSNKLVFLYSAPPCPEGQHVRVQFSDADGPIVYTPYQTCRAQMSNNFYLAGLQANTTYAAHQVVNTGAALQNGPDLTFTTGDPPADVYADTVLTPARSRAPERILLGSPFGGRPVAHDLNGKVVWYGPDGITTLTRPESGGEMWAIVEDFEGDASDQVIRKFDLAGVTVLETNAARVNDQLRAMGKREITAFHHEVRTLSGGRIAALADVEQLLTDVQGPGSVDVIGDMIVVLDRDLNVVWTWDAFDNLDVGRAAVLGETCSRAGACAPYHLAADANDWTHGNSLQETPDGHLLYSARHQDWLIKIAYRRGAGDGHILWRMGKDGDFRITSDDPYPWFSHQHDGNFELQDPSRLLVFDNGNTRVAGSGGNSRGQVFEVDEVNRAVTPVLNADLGVYSSAVGSAQLLRGGTYHFDAGFVQEGSAIAALSFEVDSAGIIRYKAHQNVINYRTFRMTDMYTPD